MHPRCQAILTQPLQYILQHHVANLHAFTHVATSDNDNHVAIPMRSVNTEKKYPITTHAEVHPKQLETTVTMRQRKNGKSTAAATAAYRRYLSSSPAATLHGKTQGFVFQFPPHASPMQDSYNHYNAFRNITSQTCTNLRIWQDQMIRIIQLVRCDL